MHRQKPDSRIANAENLDDEERVLALHCDVSQPDQVRTSIDRGVARFGRIDYLVNNAGVAVFKPIGATSFDKWRTVFATGFLCSPAASFVNGQVIAVDGGFEAAGVGLATLRKTAQRPE